MSKEWSTSCGVVVVLQDALMQNAAFQDVCYLAEAKGQEAWRRKKVFAQESGEAWQQIGTTCMEEVRFHYCSIA